MPVSETEPVVNEEIWNAWVQKGRDSEAATNRKLRSFLGIVVVLLALGGAYYRLAVR